MQPDAISVRRFALTLILFYIFLKFMPYTEIGIGLTAVGIFFTILGVALFFDGALLAVGNVSEYSFESSKAPHSPLFN